MSSDIQVHDLRPKRKRFSIGTAVRKGSEHGEVMWVDKHGVTVKYDDGHSQHFPWHEAYTHLVIV